MEYYVHFKSHFSSVINVENTQLGFLDNICDTLSIKTDLKTLFVQIHPIEKHAMECISYCVLLQFSNNKLITQNNNVQVFNYGNNHFEIVFEPFKICPKFKKQILFSKQLDDTTFASLIYNGNTFLEIKTNNSYYNFEIEEYIKDIKIEKFEHNSSVFIILSGKTHENLSFLQVFCNFFCNLCLTADKITFENNQIECVTYLNDVANQAVIQRYSISQTDYNLVEEFIIFPAHHPVMEQNKHLIPWAFMEAVNYGNTKLAKQYLSSELNSILDDAHLRTFFGNYNQVEWNKYSNIPFSLCLFYEKFEKAKIFKFEITQNKITNIVELD